MADTKVESFNEVRGQRIDFRTSVYHKQLIQKAAEQSGISMADFILQIVVPEAERIAADPSKILLSEKDIGRFYQELDRKPVVLPNLRKLAEQESRFVSPE